MNRAYDLRRAGGYGDHKLGDIKMGYDFWFGWGAGMVNAGAILYAFFDATVNNPKMSRAAGTLSVLGVLGVIISLIMKGCG